MMPKIGEPAPDFALMTHAGKQIALAKLRGRKVLLWFYPEADTPGCTAEGRGFRDQISDFEQNNIQVLGISFNDVEQNAAFAEKHRVSISIALRYRSQCRPRVRRLCR